MCDLSLLNGMATVSLCAELAFRTRVNMSAIGSVIVIGLLRPSHRGFIRSAGLRLTFDVDGLLCMPRGRGGEVCAGLVPHGIPGMFSSGATSPGRLGHAGELAAVGHLPEADP